MLKKKVPNLDGVDEKYHGLYTEVNGEFVLDSNVVGDGDTTGMKENSAKLLAEKTALQEQLAALETAATQKNEDELGAKGEYEKLIGIKQEQFDTQLAAANERADTAELALKDSVVTISTQAIAAEVFVDPELFAHMIQERTQAVDVGGKLVAQFTDANGNPAPQMTAAQLIEEFKNNDKLKRYVKGRDSSGGGAPGADGSGGSADDGEWDKYFKPNSPEYNAMKQGELQDKNPGLYDSLSKKHGLNDPYAIPQHGVARHG